MFYWWSSACSYGYLCVKIIIFAYLAYLTSLTYDNFWMSLLWNLRLSPIILLSNVLLCFDVHEFSDIHLETQKQYILCELAVYDIAVHTAQYTSTIIYKLHPYNARRLKDMTRVWTVSIEHILLLYCNHHIYIAVPGLNFR